MLADFLAGKTDPERLEFEARAPAMISEFLADEAPAVAKARHPFTFFVTAFGGLGVPRQEARAGPGKVSTADSFAKFQARNGDPKA